LLAGRRNPDIRDERSNLIGPDIELAMQRTLCDRRRALDDKLRLVSAT
jgi:hypothetical protein